MIPEQVDPKTKSDAEKQLFRRLNLLEDDAWSHALHSLNLAEHRWKRVGEIDFLLIGEKGIFVLEVKGGKVACENGTWKYTNRYGRTTTKRASPFSQARSAMFAMQERLEKSVDGRLVDRTVFGHAVVFPDQEFDLESVEWDPEMVIDKRQLDRPDGLARSINRLAAYWREKPGRRDRRLGPDDIDQYLQALRPDYDVVPTLQRLAESADEEIAALTERQYAALDAAGRNERVVYEGGAGTGKTMLAAELCRRWTRAGERVLFTCQSPVIAAHVSRQPGLEGVVALPMSTVTEEDGPFDVLVVDEAQDVANVADLLQLDAVLKGGLQDGRWYLFLDSNNQRGLIGSYEQEGMDHLLATRPALFTLNDNCRNTATIVSEVTRITGADIGVSTAGVGPRVEVQQVADSKVAGREAGKLLDRLVQEGVSPDDIMLLSPLPLGQSSFAHLPGKWSQRIEALDVNSWLSRPQSRLGFATISSFKGLESRFVVVADLAPPNDEASPSPELYVGMTRARVGLFVFMNASASPHSSQGDE
ncbi:nuclease-related domain-containing DEAD/DEAH box helicase [Terracoccus sp. 273MFTsu3.1]|uniref:nuclease-related domain-containing DEAD/DEAH box helicase n=1 Tax=Terracoccus sp. 273MFTsu3.1 TaxID=1172188 RepID=UPI000381B9D8|nr:NERD domain-containing protein [Terracoccus sp. 273MFTsu3.1]